MFKIEGNILMVTLPQGKTMKELTEMSKSEIRTLIESGQTYGKDIKINGRITTSIACLLGHELAHVCRSVSIFDPKEGEYVLCIAH